MPFTRVLDKQSPVLFFLQMGIALTLTFFFQNLGFQDPLLYAAATYISLALVIRFAMLFHHYRAMSYYRKSEYEQSIQAFEKSYTHLKKWRGIDKYRYITMLSSKISFLEIALIGIAHNYVQLGDKSKAKEFYNKAILEFPNSNLPKDELKKLESNKDNTSKKTKKNK